MDTIYDTEARVADEHVDTRINRDIREYCWQCVGAFALAIFGVFMIGIIFPFTTAGVWSLVVGMLSFILSIVMGVMGYSTVRERGRKGRVFGFAGAVLSTLLIISSLFSYATVMGMSNRPFYDVNVIERTTGRL